MGFKVFLRCVPFHVFFFRCFLPLSGNLCRSHPELFGCFEPWLDVNCIVPSINRLKNPYSGSFNLYALWIKCNQILIFTSNPRNQHIFLLIKSQFLGCCNSQCFPFNPLNSEQFATQNIYLICSWKHWFPAQIVPIHWTIHFWDAWIPIVLDSMRL